MLDQVAVDCRDDLAAIYAKYWDLVYKRCYATLNDHEAALDATQDVFLQALNSFEDIRHDIVRGLMDIARTISYERRRRPTREVSLADPPHANGHDPAEIAEQQRILDVVWSGLSPVERRYVADWFAGFSFEEIARRNRRALGTVSSNLARAREHARKMREPLLPSLLGLAVWRRLTDASRRARSVAHSSSLAAAAQPVGSLTVSLTVATLVASAVPLTTAAQGGMHTLTQASGVATLDELTLNASRAGAAMAHPVFLAPAAEAAPRSAAGGGLALPHLVPTGSAAAETPEDTEIYTATASPNYQRDHTIVALGDGNQCSCTVLLMSTDGGATWTAAPGPKYGDHIVLPPAFPADPAIYVDFAGAPGAALANSWTPRFGVDFSALQGLPAGQLALPAGFDSGDARILAATPTGVWSKALGSGSVQALLVETRGTRPSMATAYGSPDAGVFVLTSSRATSPGSTAVGMATQDSEVLWSCPPGGGCAQLASTDLPVGSQVLASPGFGTDRTVVVYGLSSVLSSADGGRSFSAVDLPWNGAAAGALEMAASPSGTALWGEFSHGTEWALMTRPSVQGSWTEADAHDPAITALGGKLIVVTSQRLLFLPAQGGLLCSVNAGVTWEARCPSA